MDQGADEPALYDSETTRRTPRVASAPATAKHHRMASEIRDAGRYCRDALARCPRLWAAALPVCGTSENSAPTPRHSCGDQYRPTRSVARWPATCQNPDLPLCSVGSLKADFDEFGNGIQNYGNPLLAEIERRTAEGQQANPFLVALDLLCYSEDDRLRLQAAEFVGDRLLPRLKAVEHSGE